MAGEGCAVKPAAFAIGRWLNRRKESLVWTGVVLAMLGEVYVENGGALPFMETITPMWRAAIGGLLGIAGLALRWRATRATR